MADEANPGDSGATPNIDLSAPEVKQAIDEAVANATRDLTGKVDEFRRNNIDLLKRVEGLKGYEGLGDPDELRKLLAHLENDELGKLLKSGKHEEWFAKRTEMMRSDYEQRVAGFEQEAKTYKSQVDELNKRIFDLQVSTNIQKASAGRVNPDVVPLIVSLAANVWKAEEEGLVPRRPDGTRWLGKDGKHDITAAEWIDSLRETMPSLFPNPGSGTGARATSGPLKGINIESLTPHQKMSVGRPGANP